MGATTKAVKKFATLGLFYAHIPSIKGNRKAGEEVLGSLLRHDGIHAGKVFPFSGNILLEYDDKVLTKEHVISMLQADNPEIVIVKESSKQLESFQLLVPLTHNNPQVAETLAVYLREGFSDGKGRVYNGCSCVIDVEYDTMYSIITVKYDAVISDREFLKERVRLIEKMVTKKSLEILPIGRTKQKTVKHLTIPQFFLLELAEQLFSKYIITGLLGLL